jgi:hypothetical protein
MKPDLRGRVTEDSQSPTLKVRLVEPDLRGRVAEDSHTRRQRFFAHFSSEARSKTTPGSWRFFTCFSFNACSKVIIIADAEGFCILFLPGTVEALRAKANGSSTLGICLGGAL